MIGRLRNTNLWLVDKVEKEIVNVLQTAGKTLEEVGKDKPSQKQADLMVTQFMNSLQEIDSKLTENIKYLSQVSTGQYHQVDILSCDWSDDSNTHFWLVVAGQPHEGSSYASQKVLQMAWHRLEHARSRVAELDR